jgi:hypothetical protein
MLRNGIFVPAVTIYIPGEDQYSSEAFAIFCTWDGKGRSSLVSEYDIIATISPEAMALAIHPDMDGAVKAIESLVKLADAVLDHADAHCRAFPIATAPDTGSFQVWDDDEKEWKPFTCYRSQNGTQAAWSRWITHWTPLPPPPSNPPLPAVFVELGAALEKIKGAT